MLLSRTYAPSAELAPYIRRFYVFEADLPQEALIQDGLLAETAFVRIVLRGNWSGEVAPGEWVTAGPAILFGANDRPFNVRVSGPFTVIGFAIRASGWRCLFNTPHYALLNLMSPLSDAWGQLSEGLVADIEAAKDDDERVAAMERCINAQLDQIGLHKPDKKIAKFEAIARVNNTMRIDEAAERIDLSPRQMERRCRESFGITPKAVLRRSRFLDMASAMRGFTSPDDAALAALRYFDQSHLNRECKRFTGMTPGAFMRAQMPLHTAGLKLREESKDTI